MNLGSEIHQKASFPCFFLRNVTSNRDSVYFDEKKDIKGHILKKIKDITGLFENYRTNKGQILKLVKLKDIKGLKYIWEVCVYNRSVNPTTNSTETFVDQITRGIYE